MADWHGAEKYVQVWPAAWSANYPSYAAYRAAKQAEDQATAQSIYNAFGGDLMVLPGDTQTGHWDEASFVTNFTSVPEYAGLTAAQVVVEASRLCYSGMKEGFGAGGYGTMLVAVGDHEVGDNDWPAGSTVSQRVPDFRRGFANIWNKDSGGNPIYTTPIGTAPARPIGTPYADTSHAVRHKNVLFVTVDIFRQDGPNTVLGESGTVIGDLTPAHLTWFRNVLEQARTIPAIDHIIVQAHLPVIAPVRKYASSGMLVEGTTGSTFLQAMRDYDVDLYLAGEVHDNTVTRDPGSELVQVVTRGNLASNVTVVDVEDDRLLLKLYKNNTQLLGDLVIDKSGPQRTIAGTGLLTPILPDGLQWHLPFDEKTPAAGVLTSFSDPIRVGGLACSEAFANLGGFSTDYTAWTAGCGIDTGKIAGAATLSPGSRIGAMAMGPLGGNFERTVACWVKTTSTGRQIVFNTTSKWSSSAQFFNLSLNNGKLELILQQGMVKTANGPTLNDGNWHHIAAVVPQTPCTLAQVRLFIDGQLQTTNLTHTGGTNVVNTTQANWMAAGTILPDAALNLGTAFGMVAFSGALDDMGVWTRALTEAEMMALVAAPAARSYDASAMEKLFRLASAESGSVEVNGDVWAFDPTVSGPSGVFVADGNERTLDLGGPGGLRATLVPDTSPPTPDPAGFASPPTALGPATVRIEALAGSDLSGPVQYRFMETSGNHGGASSAWQTSPSFTATGLLPGTRYAYTVRMRDALGNTGAASAPVEVTTPLQPPGPQLVIAWHTPETTAEGTPMNDATPDVALPGVTGSLSGGRDAWATFNSGDLRYGNLAAPAAPAGANAVRTRTTGSENLITVTLTNGTGAGLKLGSFHFDFGGFDAGPRDFQLIYLSGDLAVAAGTEIGRGNRGAGSSNNSNYADFDLPFAPALADTTLAHGQSASFRLVFSNATSATTASGVDNIAITTTAPGGPDRDGDGIPDADEALLNLNPDNPADAALDRDGDGSSNLAEFMAGSSLDSAADFPRLAVVETNPEAIQLELSRVVPGRTYILEHSPDLAAVLRWTAVGAVSAAVVGSHVFEQALTGARGFYRLRIEWSP
ncbi:MAG: LamG domain-containing protein [Akkermansiaceae bacterium]|nr:LamG domain-containing protein [Akkermansiaceae bacterium]